MMRQRMTDAPVAIIKKSQIEIIHSEVVATMEEIVCRDDRIAKTQARDQHQKATVEFHCHCCHHKGQKQKRIDVELNENERK